MVLFLRTIVSSYRYSYIFLKNKSNFLVLRKEKLHGNKVAPSLFIPCSRALTWHWFDPGAHMALGKLQHSHLGFAELLQEKALFDLLPCL